MRKTGLIAAIAASCVALPATAMTPGQANCPVRLAPKDLGARLVQEVLNYKEGQDTDPNLTEAIKHLEDVCVQREKVPAAQQDVYIRYVMARLSHDELVRQLGAMKVPVTVIDSIFGIGPGRQNPSPDQVTEDQFNALVSALEKAGVSIEKLPDQALGMMGV